MSFSGKAGDRVKLISMPDDPDPIPYGTLGTIRSTTDLHFTGTHETQVHINWDNGRSLSCICPPDRLEIISVAAEKPVAY